MMYLGWAVIEHFPFLFPADDDSDTSPHDYEGGGSDTEYGQHGLSLASQLSVGQHAFTQMQVRFS